MDVKREMKTIKEDIGKIKEKFFIWIAILLSLNIITLLFTIFLFVVKVGNEDVKGLRLDLKELSKDIYKEKLQDNLYKKQIKDKIDKKLKEIGE